MTGISVVIPVHNGAPWLADVIDAIGREASGRPFEILVIDDRSTDASRPIAESLAERWPIRILEGRGCGAAAAINLGIQAAAFPLICQLDQDVVVLEGWLERLLTVLDDPSIAAAQGHYVAAPDASLAERISAFDLAQRYERLEGPSVDHVCTGNTIYRASALAAIGGFDEAFGYGYDNDLSYRLTTAGFQLAFVSAATSIHHWRRGLGGYWRQQYGQGYGRLQLVARHPRRVAGDDVSRVFMMLHPVIAAGSLAMASTALAGAVAGAAWKGAAAWTAVALMGWLAVERTAAGVRAAARYRSGVPLLFPVFHLFRDLSWVAAIGMWSVRRVLGRSPGPAESMRGRAVVPHGANRPGVLAPGGHLDARVEVPQQAPPASSDALAIAADARVLVLIPAHNESQALPQVIQDVRRHCPRAGVLVIDDGSSDDTATVAARAGVNWIRLPERMGIGSAMRAGLRYARRRRADVVVRLDGDGQHRAAEIASIVAPVLSDRADVVLGSRYVPSGEGRRGPVRIVQRILGACLSWLTGQAVTDPTSGFYALGPSAVRLLCDHHPTGYPEPELRLLLSRCNVRVLEMPMRTRRRQGGRTSLTAVRIAGAAARVLLAMVIVPLRHATDAGDHD